MPKHPFEIVYDSLKEAAHEVHLLLPHRQADGDALAACVGLSAFLNANNLPAIILLSEPLPKYLQPFAAGQDIRVYEKDMTFPENRANIFVDCHAADRLQERAVILKNGDRYAIDHHLVETEAPELSWIDKGRASCADMVAEVMLLAEAGDFSDATMTISPELATAVMVGLYTDSGGFRHSNTNSRLFQIAAALKEHGADIDKISQNVFANHRLTRQRLRGKVLSEFELLADGKLAAMIVTRDDHLERDLDNADFEGIVNDMLDTEGCYMSALVRELPTKSVQVSLRSRNGANVQAIASRYGGGGHIQASGLTLTPQQLGELFPEIPKEQRIRHLLDVFAELLDAQLA